MSLAETMQQAIAHHQAGQLNDAEKLYRAVLQIQPQHPDANHNLGVLALQVDQPRAALPFLQSALHSNPANGQHWLSLAECHVRLHEWDKAEATLKDAEQAGLKHPAVADLRNRIMLGRESTNIDGTAFELSAVEALREAGQWQQAADAAHALLRAAPDRPEIWALLAQILPQLSKMEEAEQAALRALALAAQNPAALRALAVIRLRQQKIEEASVLAEQAFSLAPGCSRTLGVLANVRMSQQRMEEADALLTRAMSIDALAEIHATRALFEARRNNPHLAIQHAEAAVNKKGFLVSAWQLLASLYQQVRRRDAAIQAFEQVRRYEPHNASALSDLGYLYLQDRQLDQAIAVLEQALKCSPESAAPWVNYGAVLQALNRAPEAMAAYEKALSLNPGQAEVHNNLGALHKQRQDWEKALASFELACQCAPNRIEFHVNRALALAQQDRLDEAVATLERIDGAAPHHASVTMALASLVARRQEWEKAEQLIRQVLDAAPDTVEAWNQLGGICNAAGRHKEALAAYQKALAIQADNHVAYSGLASAFLAAGDILKAFECGKRALQLNETPETTLRFVQCIKNLVFTEDDADSRLLLSRAVSEPWCRPDDLAAPSISLIKLHPDIRDYIRRASASRPATPQECDLLGAAGLKLASQDPLLQRLLENVSICDAELERFLTVARTEMLKIAIDATPHSALQESMIDLHCALARQCFINEFVFAYLPEEVEWARLLREKLETALATGVPFPIIWLPAVGSYFPLYSLPSARALLSLAVPASVMALVKQQVREPDEERAYRDLIPDVTGIGDGVSRLVRQQYEENPYPRWVQSAPVAKAASVDAYLRQLFPRASLQPVARSGAADILIAGCGTGRQSIQAAKRFPQARILAVDLSLTSLCYARRKTDELGLPNIEYAQADIMRLGSMNWTFDVIESVGVLHHLEQPMEGWRILSGLLRPHGLMRLGFYSELGRREVVAGRRFIAEHGYTADAADIRKCRQQLMSMDDGSRLTQLITSFRDFYSMSECRDLLFHVQEHRYTIPQLKRCLDDLQLRFIGFTNLEPWVEKEYRQLFAEDESMTNLACWHAFELDNPDTFIGMYQFWVQKDGDSATP